MRDELLGVGREGVARRGERERPRQREVGLRDEAERAHRLEGAHALERLHIVLLVRLRPELQLEAGGRVRRQVARGRRDREDGRLRILGRALVVAVGHHPQHLQLARRVVGQPHCLLVGGAQPRARPKVDALLVERDGAMLPCGAAEEAAHQRLLRRGLERRRHVRSRRLERDELVVVVHRLAALERRHPRVGARLQFLRREAVQPLRLACQVFGHEARLDRQWPPLVVVAGADQIDRLRLGVEEEEVDALVVVPRLLRREGEVDVKRLARQQHAGRRRNAEEPIRLGASQLEGHRRVGGRDELEHARRLLARQHDGHVAERDDVLGDRDLGADGLADTLERHRVAAGRLHLVVVGGEGASHLGPELYRDRQLAIGRDDA